MRRSAPSQDAPCDPLGPTAPVHRGPTGRPPAGRSASAYIAQGGGLHPDLDQARATLDARAWPRHRASRPAAAQPTPCSPRPRPGTPTSRHPPSRAHRPPASGRPEGLSPPREPANGGHRGGGSPPQRTMRKKVRMSSTSRSGASMAAKWPPRSNSDQCTTLCSRSAIRRTPGRRGRPRRRAAGSSTRPRAPGRAGSPCRGGRTRRRSR